MTPPIDAHVHLDTHPTHPSAVTAVLTGSQAHVAHLGLEAAGWSVVADNVLALVRIDHEEPYWAAQAARILTGEGITVEITPRLQEAVDEEWTWANHPMPWCTRDEIRDVSDQAQKIYDDIRHGRLFIHAHATDNGTTTAVGSYRDTGKSVHLHGEDHLRQIADTFDSPALALAAFQQAHGDALQVGPAPMTDTERQAAQARTSLVAPAAPPPERPALEEVPAYAADPADHEAALDAFLADNGDWERYNTWDDNTTVATHESLTLRILFDHQAGPRDATWEIAAYETPVSERMWNMTVTPTTPDPVLTAVLTALASGEAWDTALGSPVTSKHITQATRPLTEVGWASSVEGRWLRWRNDAGDAGVQFDAFAAQNPNAPLHTWTLWAGPSIDHPTWSIHASAYTPAALLADLSGELTYGSGTRQSDPRTAAPAQQKPRAPRR
ncbi:DUF317 domain-containing protein [Streptomyces sp. NPDC091215]|uniref:DUF317 domain-containing protein n=1 Tax=Streptomyces sp. NPDC091215 TaxID=3155192 RepID=UPI0034445C09